jgi:hypothetical protein
MVKARVAQERGSYTALCECNLRCSSGARPDFTADTGGRISFGGRNSEPARSAQRSRLASGVRSVGRRLRVLSRVHPAQLVPDPDSVNLAGRRLMSPRRFLLSRASIDKGYRVWSRLPSDWQQIASKRHHHPQLPLLFARFWSCRRNRQRRFTPSNSSSHGVVHFFVSQSR